MKKLFISCPIQGRTPEAIFETYAKLHRAAEILVGEDLEVVNEFKPKGKYVNSPIEYTGQQIKYLAKADYFIGPDDSWMYPICGIFSNAANTFGIERLDFGTRFICRDIVEAEEKCLEEKIANKMAKSLAKKIDKVGLRVIAKEVVTEDERGELTPLDPNAGQDIHEV